MMIETIGVAVVVGTALTLAITLSMPALRKWRDLRRSNEPVGSGAVATDSAFHAEKNRLADLKAELTAAETSLAERERQISVKLGELTAAQRERTDAAGELAKQEAALAERERILEQSLADATRNAAEAKARIEARKAALATQEAALQQQEIEAREAALATEEAGLQQHESESESEPADPPHRSAAERDLIWWEKQLGRPRSAEK
jgi:chromosome segregation ATPase